ncbi:MAG: HD domain-containing protein [Phycisphaerales bacterium]|nr:HD domain-containing protein [Phycisphaerales bacterium]
MSSIHKLRVRGAAILTAVITVLHFSITTQSHGLHWIHIVLAGAYLVPVLVAAVAYERMGGLVAATGVSGLYLLHLLWSWQDSQMANLDQFAWLAIYPLVGFVTGHLVRVSNEQTRQRDEFVEQSRHTELINGITGLLTAVGVRDTATIEHSHRVAALAKKVGEELGFDKQTLSNLFLASLVHDIGKVGIPDAILFHHGRLDDEQMAAMRDHVELAVTMLLEIPGTDDIARLVAQHHESPDGSGYPHGISGDQIDPAAAALRVADIFTAITEDRVYHDAMSTDEAIEAMRKLDGDQLDTMAFETLVWIVRCDQVNGIHTESFKSADGEPQ